MNDSNWVDGFIQRLEATPQVQIRDVSGNDVMVAIGHGLLTYLIANRVRLAQVSYNTFLTFLDLMSKQKDLAALIVIYEEMDNESLLEKYKEDTIKLAQIAEQTIETRNFWISFSKQVAGSLVSSALGVILKGITL